jgi:hypothetical protein
MSTITVPTDTVVPSSTCSATTVPVQGTGISTTALSVSIWHNASSSVTD